MIELFLKLASRMACCVRDCARAHACARSSFRSARAGCICAANGTATVILSADPHFRRYLANTTTDCDGICVAWSIVALCTFMYAVAMGALLPYFTPRYSRGPNSPHEYVWDSADSFPSSTRARLEFETLAGGCESTAVALMSVFDPADFPECLRAAEPTMAEPSSTGGLATETTAALSLVSELVREMPAQSFGERSERVYEMAAPAAAAHCVRAAAEPLLRARVAAVTQILAPALAQRCPNDVLIKIVAGSPAHKVVASARANEPEAQALLLVVESLRPELGLAPNSWLLDAACAAAPRVIWVGGGRHGVFREDARSLERGRAAAVFADLSAPAFAARLARASGVLLRGLDGRPVFEPVGHMAGAPSAEFATRAAALATWWRIFFQTAGVLAALIVRSVFRRVDVFIFLALCLYVMITTACFYRRQIWWLESRLAHCVYAETCSCADYLTPQFRQPARELWPPQQFVDHAVVLANPREPPAPGAPDCLDLFRAGATGACVSGIRAATVTKTVSEVAAGNLTGYRGARGYGVCLPPERQHEYLFDYWETLAAYTFWMSMAVAFLF